MLEGVFGCFKVTVGLPKIRSVLLQMLQNDT
jgi:hypothetical protein